MIDRKKNYTQKSIFYQLFSQIPEKPKIGKIFAE